MRMKGQADLLAAVDAAPRLPVFYYHEGGFVSMDGESVHAGGHGRLDARTSAHGYRHT